MDPEIKKLAEAALQQLENPQLMAHYAKLPEGPAKDLYDKEIRRRVSRILMEGLKDFLGRGAFPIFDLDASLKSYLYP